MNKDQDRMVYRRPEDRKWVNQRFDAGRPSTVHDTQADAVATATDMLHNQGGGELIVKGLNGRIRSKDTISPGHDPESVHDTEH